MTAATHDFATIARKGSYVYCYLDAQTRKPYYVGISSRAARPLEPHGACEVPADVALVRVLRSGLSWREAQQWECFYISRFGRAAAGTGSLLNKTEGGEGSVGYVHAESSKLLMSQNRRGKPAWNKGVPMADEQKAKLSIAKQGAGPLPQEVKAKISSALKGRNTWSKGRVATEETRAKMAEARRGKKHPPDSCIKRASSRLAHTASKHGLTFDQWAGLTALQRNSMYRWLKQNSGATPLDYVEFCMAKIAHILE